MVSREISTLRDEISTEPTLILPLSWVADVYHGATFRYGSKCDQYIEEVEIGLHKWNKEIFCFWYDAAHEAEMVCAYDLFFQVHA